MSMSRVMLAGQPQINWHRSRPGSHPFRFRLSHANRHPIPPQKYDPRHYVARVSVCIITLRSTGHASRHVQKPSQPATVGGLDLGPFEVGWRWGPEFRDLVTCQIGDLERMSRSKSDKVSAYPNMRIVLPASSEDSYIYM